MIFLKPYLLGTLKELALLGSIKNRIEISSLELGKQLNVSQQTASRYLLQLDQKDLIKREMGVKKQLVKLTENGLNVLQQEFSDYQKIFDLGEKISFSGEVVSGLGEGRYYTEQKGYMDQFKEKIGFIPHPGTLNVKIKNVEKNKLRLLKNFDGVTINSFQTTRRTFGSVRCFKAEINNVKGAMVLPSRGHYSNIIEFISPMYLRGKLGLKDGDQVEIIIYSTPHGFLKT